MEDRAEILSRVALIEQMIAAGKRKTARNGWVFIVWGLGYLAAIAWATLAPRPDLAWLVVMPLCGVVTGVGLSRRRRNEGPRTDSERSVGSVWVATSLAFVPLVLCSGAYPAGGVAVVIFLLIGIANMVSGLVLSWRSQQIVGLLWWVCAAALANAPAAWAPWIFVANATVCQVGFGVYLMALEKAEQRRG